MRAFALSLVVCCAVAAAPALAVDQPVSAKKLKMKSSSGTGKLTLSSKDTNLQLPVGGGPDDPTLVGAELTLCSGDGQVGSLAMPAAGWSFSKPGTALKFKLKGSTGVKVVALKGGKALKLVSRDTGIEPNGALGAVGVRLTMGTLRQCALFDASTVKRDEAGRFDARDASAGALADCSNAALGCAGSPSGAFLDLD